MPPAAELPQRAAKNRHGQTRPVPRQTLVQSRGTSDAPISSHEARLTSPPAQTHGRSLRAKKMPPTFHVLHREIRSRRQEDLLAHF